MRCFILGRWINRDPIGEHGGINLYGFLYNNSISYFDSLGLRKLCPESQECKDLSKKMENILKEIKQRIKELEENSQNLPEHHPDELTKPGLSREGHRRIIKDLQDIYQQRLNLYIDKCGPPPPDFPLQLEIAPQYLPQEDSSQNNMIGTDIIIGGIVIGVEIYVGYRIIRLIPSIAFPPLLIPNLLLP